MTITISPAAVAQLQHELALPGAFLRITIAPGGCAGMTCTATVDTEARDGDQDVLAQPGIRIVSDIFSIHFLNGLMIDFSTDLIKPGFSFRNQFASEACGCGASFSL